MRGWVRKSAMAGLMFMSLAATNEAAAGSETGLDPESLRPGGLVSALRANGAEVLSLGARGGLEGYFVTPAAGGGYSLYVTGDGHAVACLLYGPDGTEVTGSQIAAARPAAAPAPPALVAHAEIRNSVVEPGLASLAGLFERSLSAFGFTLGKRGPVAVLLGDAACPSSRSAAARLGRAALDGRLQLRVVPVAVLGGAAARRAAGIAASPDPAIAWFEGGGTADRTGAGGSRATTRCSTSGAQARCRSSPGGRAKALSRIASATSTMSTPGSRTPSGWETLVPGTNHE